MSAKPGLSQTSTSAKSKQVRVFLYVAFKTNHFLMLYQYKTTNYKPFLIFNGRLALSLAIPAI
jgi:hypothetical protein